MKLKKGDFFIVIILVLASISWFMADYILPGSMSKQAVIEIDGQVFTTIPLDSNNEPQIIPLTLPDDNEKYFTVMTEKGQIWVEEADCPNQVCVNTGKISKPNQSIVCLPNKVIIYIESSEKSDVDDIAF